MYEYYVLKWQWSFDTDPTKPDPDVKKLQDCLNMFAAQGWRVVAHEFAKGWSTWVFILERPKQANPFGWMGN